MCACCISLKFGNINLYYMDPVLVHISWSTKAPPTLCPNLFMKGSQSEEGDLEWHAKGAKIDCTKAKKNKDYLELRIIQS